MPKGKKRSLSKLSNGKLTYECSKCGGWYTKSKFYADIGAKYNIRGDCIDCHKVAGKKRYKSRKTTKKSRTKKLAPASVDVGTIMVELRSAIVSKVVPAIQVIIENAVREIDKKRSKEIEDALVDRVSEILKVDLSKWK